MKKLTIETLEELTDWAHPTSAKDAGVGSYQLLLSINIDNTFNCELMCQSKDNADNFDMEFYDDHYPLDDLEKFVDEKSYDYESIQKTILDHAKNEAVEWYNNNYKLTVKIDDSSHECNEFCKWINENTNHSASLTKEGCNSINDFKTHTHDWSQIIINELWEDYCNS